MTSLRLNTCAFLASLLAACSGHSNGTGSPDAAPDTVPDSAVNPGGGNNSGTGTSTLVVNGSAVASPAINNSGDPANFTTDLLVRVTLGSTDVTTGTVSIQSSGGTIPLIYDAGTMRWHGAQAGYFQVYTLDVVSGTDAVHGVRVDGPDIHTFSAPTAGASVNSTMNLPVSWARSEMADTASLRTRLLNTITISDTGTYSLPAGSLRSRPAQTENERLDLSRTDRITPAGAAAGSSFEVTVGNSIDVVVQPTM